MTGLLVGLFLLASAVALSRRRRPRAGEDAKEPWRASLREADDDEPLDLEEIRRAEEEWEASGGFDGGEDEDWRG